MKTIEERVDNIEKWIENKDKEKWRWMDDARFAMGKQTYRSGDVVTTGDGYIFLYSHLTPGTGSDKGVQSIGGIYLYLDDLSWVLRKTENPVGVCRASKLLKAERKDEDRFFEALRNAGMICVEKGGRIDDVVKIKDKWDTIYNQFKCISPILFVKDFDLSELNMKKEIRNPILKSEKFKDGDFVAKKHQGSENGDVICIYKATGKGGEIVTYAGCSLYLTTTTTGPGWGLTDSFEKANTAQQTVLINALEKKGKKWDAQAKKVVDLEYVPKEGDFVTLEYMRGRKALICFRRFGRDGGIESAFDKTDNGNFYNCPSVYFKRNLVKTRPSTEEEQKELLSLLEKSGKRWDAEEKKVVDLEWKPKEGDVVVNILGSIYIYKAGCNPVINSYYASFYEGNFYTNGLVHSRGTRLATREERCKFFGRLVKEGYKWDSRKLKLTKVDLRPEEIRKGEFTKNKKWRAKIGSSYSFIYERLGEFIMIETIEQGHEMDDSRYKFGNYFNPATGDADVALKKIKNIFKGKG